jgi:hypothetical protein
MLLEIFPIFGLIAFVLLWTHTILGVFEPWLHTRWPRLFDGYVHWSAVTILVCIILHPLLLLIALNFSLADVLAINSPYVLFGVIGWCLLIIYDITKPFRRYNFIARNWTNILIISNIGFVFTFFHSLHVSGDFDIGFMHWLWIFLGVTAIASLIWTYGIRKMLTQN